MKRKFEYTLGELTSILSNRIKNTENLQGWESDIRVVGPEHGDMFDKMDALQQVTILISFTEPAHQAHDEKD